MEKDILEQTAAKIQLQEELAASRVKLNESQAECESTKQQLNTTVDDVELMRSQMKGEVERHLSEVAEIQSNMEKVEVRLEEEVSQRVLLEALKVELTGRLEEKQAESEDSKKQLRLKDEEIENLTHDMEITRTSHLNKEALLTSSNDRIQALTAQMGAMEDNHRCEVEKFEVEGRKRLDQLGSAGEEMGRLQAEVAELKAEMERREELCKEHMEAFNRRNAEAEHMKEGMSSKVELLEKRLGDVEDLLKEEEKKLKETQEVSKEHEDNIRSLKQELVAAKEIKEQVQEGKQRQADLEAELEQLSTSKAEMSVQMEMMAASS